MLLQSPWSLIQVLSGHENPERCLVIGDVAPRTYESAGVLGHLPEVVEPEHVHKVTAGESANGKYDLVLIVDDQIGTNAISSEFLHRMLHHDGVCMRIKSTGKIAALRNVFARKRETEGDSGLLRPCIGDQPAPIMEWVPQERYLLKGAKAWESVAVASEQSPRVLSNAIIGDERNLRALLLKLSIRTMITAGLPAEALFPKCLVVYRKRKKRDKQIPLISRARVTGRALTLTSDESFYRLDPGCGSVKAEARLLEVLDSSACKDHLISPQSTVSMSGLNGFRYEYFPGHAASSGSESLYHDTALSFLVRLSQVHPPDFLEPARARLSRYLVRRLPDNGSREEALQLLKVLSDADAFRFVTHGEFRVGNFRPGLNGQVKFVDWVQAYSGHPLIDWWRFVYDTGAPQSPVSVPEELRKGLAEPEIRMLWAVWKAAYGL